ncbi:uncharacterized protein ACN2A1_008619 [Glossina fuscipes fuscipes]
MMTASSVEFFPCRVQLMGLPRSTATATASSGDLPTALVQRNTPNITQTTSTVTYRRPPLAKVQGVSRNLFGTPKPGEINQLFQKEAQRQRSYVLQRYNFDIASGKPTTKQQHPTAAVVKANININERYLVTQIPGSLIERELQEHEQRLQKEKCSLNRSPPDEIKCSNFKQKATKNLSSGLKVLRNRTINPSITCQGDSTLPAAAATSAAPGASLFLLSSSSERYKPYSRQTLITECFNLRKNKQFIAAGSGGVVGKLIKTAAKYEVLKLPQEEITTATVTATTTTTATTTATGTATATGTGTSCQLHSTDLSVNNKKCLEGREDNTDNSNNKHVNNNLQTDNTKSNTIDTNNDDNNNDNDNDDGGDDNDDDDNDNDDDDDDDDDIDTLTATGGTTIMLQVSVSAQKASRNMTSISTANAPHTHHA